MPKYKLTHEQIVQIEQSKWLTVRERRVFKLFYCDGIRIEDIAAELDMSRRTVDRILTKIRNVVEMA